MPEPPPLTCWLPDPLPPGARAALDRIRAIPDIARIAVMPDAHLAGETCNGTVIATHHLLLPQAIGGDIGCGMACVAFDASASLLHSPHVAEHLFDLLPRLAPSSRQRKEGLNDLPSGIGFSAPELQRVFTREGRWQLGTLGQGNHFIEFQSDEAGRLWLMLHSGSRALGQAVLKHHLARAPTIIQGLACFEADTPQGQAYLADARLAMDYARCNRRALLEAITSALSVTYGVRPLAESILDCDHNHVRQEMHEGRWLWVHRKGAIEARAGQPGLTPGSMGTWSYHVEGRGYPAALSSSAHGAGRAVDRRQAFQTISLRAFARQMKGVWYDPRTMDRMRDEAPGAYKDIQAVMRAQHDLTRIVRRLRPVLCYKGVAPA